jgi:ABC-type amino acid transport substrate-binding protein
MKKQITVRGGALGALLFCLLLSGGLLTADNPGAQNPVPTLVPPTLVPPVDTGLIDALPSESAVARIQRDGKVRVGILYNEPPFGELSARGDVFGFDADLARAMGEAWGVEVELVQVTRQTAIDTLKKGDVDMLLAAQIHRRELDNEVEFSQTYFPGNEMLMVRQGDGATVLGHMDGRKVGVVMGTRGEQAVSEWLARTGLNVTVQQYLTLDQAISALLASEVDGIVENQVRLTRVLSDQSLARFVDEPVSPEPYAVAMRRQDVNMRNLVNRTLQYLVDTGKMNEMHQTHFAGAAYPLDKFTMWGGLGEDAPTPSQFGTDIPFPQYVLPRLQNESVLHVAGVVDLPDDADDAQKHLDQVNRAVIEAIAARWGMRVEYVPNSVDNALDLVASGQADLAVGVQPDWSWADRVDFTDYYLLHGDRLLVAKDSPIEGFNDMRGDVVGLLASEPGVEDRVKAILDDLRVRASTFMILRDEDALYGMQVENNYHAVFGDSLKLIPMVQANPDDVRLTINNENGGWYSRQYISFAVPRNDIDFRLLVEYTLQEVSRDGTLGSVLAPVMLSEDIQPLDIWPGSSEYLGYHLAG